MSMQRFDAEIVRSDDRAHVAIPFDPDEAWGAKERHYVTGSIEGHTIRGCLDTDGNPCLLPIGAAWLRDNDLGDKTSVEMSLAPDGHQVKTVSPDIGDALKANSQARAFFESLAPFYRNNYIRWIEDARKPETRSRRITEMISLLNSGKRQK